MSVVYQLLVTPARAKAYLEDGLDHFCGFAVEANEVSDVTEVADLISLLRGDAGTTGHASHVGTTNIGAATSTIGVPFAPDQPIDVLHVPASPFVRARLAVDPLHEEAIHGGVIEDPPFDGTGVASAAGVTTALLWIEPTRLSTGSKLWRFQPGNPIPQLLGIYHGVAWGWENLAEGTFRAAAPSQMVGPVVQREWGIANADVEVHGSQPAIVTLVSRDRPAEDGFEQLPNGLWTKRLEGGEDLDIHERQWLGQVNDVPVRLVGTARGDDGVQLAHAVSMLLDAPFVTQRGFSRQGPGVLSTLCPFEEVAGLHTVTVRVTHWDMSDFGPIGLQATKPRDITDVEQLVGDAGAALKAVAPAGWTQAHLVVQIVGEQLDFSASAELGGQRAEIASLPGALVKYARQIKKAMAKPGFGAPLSLTLTCTPEGPTKLTASLNDDEAPPFADRVPAEQWRRELQDFPRSTAPAWAAERFGD